MPALKLATARSPSSRVHAALSLLLQALYSSVDGNHKLCFQINPLGRAKLNAP